MSKRVVGYIRVSTGHQVESGLSLDDQRAKIQAYCELYDLQLVNTLADEGCSGRSLKGRSALATITEMAERGEIDGIVIAKLDRLTRSVRDLQTILDGLLTHAELHSVSEKIDTSSSTGRLILNVLTSVASWEAEVAGERTSAALQQKRSQAQERENESASAEGRKARRTRINGRAPFGYRWEDGVLVHHAKEQAVIRALVNLRAKGYTYTAIGNFLAEEGYLTSKGAPYQSTAIKRIIQRHQEETA
jgi:DNA invertase Pin-like site-specific DNA recombinase